MHDLAMAHRGTRIPLGSRGQHPLGISLKKGPSTVQPVPGVDDDRTLEPQTQP
jgi:hypothetical protein